MLKTKDDYRQVLIDLSAKHSVFNRVQLQLMSRFSTYETIRMINWLLDNHYVENHNEKVENKFAYIITESGRWFMFHRDEPLRLKIKEDKGRPLRECPICHKLFIASRRTQITCGAANVDGIKCSIIRTNSITFSRRSTPKSEFATTRLSRRIEIEDDVTFY